MKRILFLAFLLCAGMVSAEELPALFDVTGVASDDVLNIRSAPSASSQIVGALKPDAIAVEAVRADGNWRLVNVGETSGWVSARYLTPSFDQADPTYPPRCFGTEPFWSLHNGNEMRLEFMGEPEAQSFTAIDGAEATGRPDKSFTVAAGDNSATLLAIITRQTCSDGMSDRQFGLSVDLFLDGVDGRQLLSGCCTLQE